MLKQQTEWRQMASPRDYEQVQNTLRKREEDYVTACAKFLSRDPLKDPVLMLPEKDGTVKALIISSKSTMIPVFFGRRVELPPPKVFKSFFQLKKLYSVQGKKEEAEILEDAIIKSGKKISETFEYNLMSLDRLDTKEPITYCNNGEVLTDWEETITINNKKESIFFRVPMSFKKEDLDAAAPLQAAYEHEEVLHKGSVFNPAASRINLSKIIATGKIIVAELTDPGAPSLTAGKINVSGESFTRFLIGGVYVLPDFRGKGIARCMTSNFIKKLFRENDIKGISLFVKKNNRPANRLYTSLGFKHQGGYRITYFYK